MGTPNPTSASAGPLSPRRLARVVLVVLPILAIAGCTAGVLLSADRSIEAERGSADPDHYRVDDLSCEADRGVPTASVAILNTDDTTRTFRVRLLMQDVDVPGQFAERTVPATLGPAESTTFEDVALGWPYPDKPPSFDVSLCGVQVFNGR